MTEATDILLKQFCDAAGWTEEDGGELGLWVDRAPGGHCIWSCKWGTSRGLTIPGELMPSGKLSRLGLYFELNDISVLTGDEILANECKAVLAEAKLDIGSSKWRQTGMSLIHKWREVANEYAFPFPPMAPPREGPGCLMNLIERPGWTWEGII